MAILRGADSVFYSAPSFLQYIGFIRKVKGNTERVRTERRLATENGFRNRRLRKKSIFLLKSTLK